MSDIKPMICIAGGGTGGHVMPALALADAAREQWDNLDVNFIGAERGLEARLLPERGEAALLLTMHSVQGAGWLQRLRVLLWELPNSVLKILSVWRKQKPKLLVGVGGYASVAGVVAALLSRIPVILYEQNAIPGLVNRVLYRFSNVMMLGFESAQQHLPHTKKSVVTGNMIRSAVSDIQYQTPEVPHLLVVGGSQGAMFLNETVPLACIRLKEKGLDFKVTHLVGAGEGRVETVGSIYAQAGINADIQAFTDDMPTLFSQASLMIARAGAMTVCEAAAVGMPALFVPLPSAADNHQYYNAKALEDVGAANIINQKECDEKGLATMLYDTLFNSALLQEMSKKSMQAFVCGAREKQLNVLNQYLGEVKS
ncbi:MAG: undecaprenyldiphospho-muramoylpentapeptide beta-N-acetylglucosaminyltransferase [Ghiorsea sp.]